MDWWLHKSCNSEVCLLFRDLIKTLVREPEAVSLQPRTCADKTVFHLQVAENDMINIMGENEQAIDYLLTLTGGKYDQLWTLKIQQEISSVP